MTPGARVAAAIEILDQVAQGAAAEQALISWARRSRFAGSKDRAAVRDHVFDAIRCMRSAQHFGRGTDGRALMIGVLHQQEADLDSLFNGIGHAPDPLTDAEKLFPAPADNRAIAGNLPDWIVPLFDLALGDSADDAARALQTRAPVTVRVNTARTDIATAQTALTEAGITTQRNRLAATALTITDGARKLRNSMPYQTGLVELQDAASQAVALALPPGQRVLDYCAGGGGKALAIAAQANRHVTAHDADPKRMVDLPDRAKRAGADITQLATADVRKAAPFDVVLCDAPCSGSGAWRRAPQGKWMLTPARLTELTQIQDDILDAASALITPKGTLAYATCSVFLEENENRVTAFLARNTGWVCAFQRRFAVDDDGDGFFVAHLTRAES